MNKEISKCPKCASQRVAEIYYGFPAFEEIEADLRAERIVLGGCVIGENDPQWRCLNCNHEFGMPSSKRRKK
jgi:hypothetical protein